MRCLACIRKPFQQHSFQMLMEFHHMKGNFWLHSVGQKSAPCFISIKGNFETIAIIAILTKQTWLFKNSTIRTHCLQMIKKLEKWPQ